MLSRLDEKGPKYTTHNIQNDVISLLATHTIRNLLDEVKNNYYSLIFDEYTDISNSEQLKISFCWIDDTFRAHKDFTGFH